MHAKQPYAHKPIMNAHNNMQQCNMTWKSNTCPKLVILKWMQLQHDATMAWCDMTCKTLTYIGPTWHESICKAKQSKLHATWQSRMKPSIANAIKSTQATN